VRRAAAAQQDSGMDYPQILALVLISTPDEEFRFHSGVPV
jgi:tRNA isopentenyl-2-thiomethyl-A-37 hydroxylase MiaE